MTTLKVHKLNIAEKAGGGCFCLEVGKIPSRHLQLNGALASFPNFMLTTVEAQVSVIIIT